MTRTYDINGKSYRFTAQNWDYIRLEVDNILRPSIDFKNWQEVEEYVKNMKKSSDK